MSVPPVPVRTSAVSTAKAPTMWPPSYHKQGSNLSEGQILHLGPLRRKSRQVHKVSPLQRPASSSLVMTPVPFAPTGDMFFKEAPLLGNASFLPKHLGGVSSVSQSASVANVRDALAVVTSPPVGGRLQVFWQTWASMGASPRVVSILKNGYTLPFQTKPPRTREPLIRSGYATIERVHNPSSLGFYNCLFLVPKPNNRWQPILDLSALNWFLHVKTFEIETPESKRLSLQQGEWVMSLDFSDAYFHIPINQVSRKYLRFHLEDQTRTLPFGLSTAPMEFTIVVKKVKLMAQAKGIRLHQYLDDWLIWSQTKEPCSYQTQALLTLCQELGWVVNLHKSELDPKQVFDFVGYQYDLNQGVVLPTLQRWQILKIHLFERQSCSVRQFISLIGLLSATEKQVLLGSLLTRHIVWYCVAPQKELAHLIICREKHAGSRRPSPSPEVVATGGLLPGQPYTLCNTLFNCLLMPQEKAGALT